MRNIKCIHVYVAIIRILLLIVATFPSLSSETPQWKNFTASTSARSIVEYGENIWIGGNLLTRLHKNTDEITFFSKDWGLYGMPIGNTAAVTSRCIGSSILSPLL